MFDWRSLSAQYSTVQYSTVQNSTVSRFSGDVYFMSYFRDKSYETKYRVR